MASKVDIVNMALSSLGSKQTIQDIDSDQSTEARTSALHYDQALLTCLEASDWSFATTWATSALLTASPPDDWAYMYAMPSNVVKMLGIVDTLDSRVNRPAKFRKTNYEGQLVLLTDTVSPVWRYIYHNDTPATYTSQFVDALAAQLAYRLAMPLTRKLDLQKMAFETYTQLIRQAAASDANEQTLNEEPDYTAPWFEDRGYDQSSRRFLYTDSDGDIQEFAGSI
jgi:hypothetical protein